jgi:hypothetical protein
MRRLRHVLARQWRRMWAGSLRHPATQRNHDEEARRWAEARDRFWTDLRQGEREAEAQRVRQHP